MKLWVFSFLFPFSSVDCNRISFLAARQTHLPSREEQPPPLLPPALGLVGVVPPLPSEKTVLHNAGDCGQGPRSEQVNQSFFA